MSEIQKVTQEMLDANPALVEAGVSVGDEVVVPAPTEQVEVPPAPASVPKPVETNQQVD